MERVWQMTGDKPADFITMNGRLHPMARYRLEQVWARSVWANANRCPKPKINGFAIVQVTFGVNDLWRRRDPMNWAPTCKPIVDTLTRLGFWPDDDSTRLSVCEPRFERSSKSIYIVTITWEEPE